MIAVAPSPYDVIADLYDDLSPGTGHRPWVERLIALAQEHGAAGRRALDIACGTGRSFGPLLEAGFSVTGVDLSGEMLARAAESFGDEVRLERADMRELPRLGRFDLALCLDDALNHLDDPADVRAALAGAAANLEPGGLLLFDVCALGAYRSARDRIADEGDRVLLWSAPGAGELEPGGRLELRADVLERADDGLWTRRSWRQPHRHHPQEELLAALGAAGFEVVRRWGQQRGGVLLPHVDEERQHKVLTLARRTPTSH